MANKQYVITVDQDADPDAVAEQLKSQGLTVEQVMREIRVISAKGNPDVNSVRKLRGVSAVEESQDFQIPPPDAPLQ